MQTRQIGSLAVSALGLGCNNFGLTMDHEATSRVVNAAIDAGITYFGTADVYSATVIAGATKPEQVWINSASTNWDITDDDRRDIGQIIATG